MSPAQTFEWNEPISCSEVGDGDNGTVDEDTKPYIPVRAYFFSTRFDFYHFFFFFLNLWCSGYGIGDWCGRLVL